MWLAFIVDRVNVFSLLRAENDRSAVALDTGIVRHKRINFVTSVKSFTASPRLNSLSITWSTLTMDASTIEGEDDNISICIFNFTLSSSQ